VNSWLTGTRLVSLPFSDHCEALLEEGQSIQPFLSEIRQKTLGRLKYAEIRCSYGELDKDPNIYVYRTYCLHIVDLRPSIDELFSRLHKNSLQRKILRAEREQVIVVQGRSELLLDEFYRLFIMTRRRHGIPPQSIAWFQNLIECFGKRLTISVARLGDRPIASILTLRHKRKLVFKYGCSDEHFHKVGAMPRLFWQAILDAKSEGIEELDLGRTDFQNAGLMRFKDNFGGHKTVLRYWRISDAPSRSLAAASALFPILQSALVHLPNPLLRMVGKILYPHVG
jgi:lipid II:glycine glycyltransferase (peptidoglycan interpeptide bridge formation enzyme)